MVLFCVVDEFVWFSEMEIIFLIIFESLMFLVEKKIVVLVMLDDVVVFFLMGEEDEFLFVDFGELLECFVVFSYWSRLVGL